MSFRRRDALAFVCSPNDIDLPPGKVHECPANDPEHFRRAVLAAAPAVCVSESGQLVDGSEVQLAQGPHPSLEPTLSYTTHLFAPI